jgi:hypothetical protein
LFSEGKQTMNRTQKVFLLGLTLVASVGCGQNYSGTYTGTETLGLNGTQGASAPLTLSLVQSSNDELSATWQGSLGNGVITGRPEGNRIGGITLNLATTAMLTSTGSVNTTTPIVSPSPMPPMNCGPYTGVLAAAGNALSGTLIRSTTTVTPTAGGIVDPNYQCPMTRSINVTR